jgi:hypothetical protein
VEVPSATIFSVVRKEIRSAGGESTSSALRLGVTGSGAAPGSRLRSLAPTAPRILDEVVGRLLQELLMPTLGLVTMEMAPPTSPPG